MFHERSHGLFYLYACVRDEEQISGTHFVGAILCIT